MGSTPRISHPFFREYPLTTCFRGFWGIGVISTGPKNSCCGHGNEVIFCIYFFFLFFQEYYRTMIDCNLNITCPWWLDWFHGGLNFHHEHHSFPRLPRNKLREASGFIKEICQRHNVLYDECGFFVALRRVLVNLCYLSHKFQKHDQRKLKRT